jgi:hypothetical protein
VEQIGDEGAGGMLLYISGREAWFAVDRKVRFNQIQTSQFGDKLFLRRIG